MLLCNQAHISMYNLEVIGGLPSHVVGIAPGGIMERKFYVRRLISMARRLLIDDAVDLLPADVKAAIPARRTRQLRLLDEQNVVDADIVTAGGARPTRALKLRTQGLPDRLATTTQEIIREGFRPGQFHQSRPHLFARHKNLRGIMVCLLLAVLFLGVMLTAGIMQRPRGAELMSNTNGQVYDVQVGGELVTTWQNQTPLPPKTPIPTVVASGTYSVLGKPTITVDMINQVLAAYHSPAAGKGQALYDLGVQYGIDPIFALAFFMHESSFGTKGEAAQSLSLGNLRCIPDHKCQDNFAFFDTWEDGFKAWYELIRNLYVAQWGRVTVDQIIPKYAPSADNNNEQGYINAVDHTVDTWRSGQIIVSA